MTARIDPVIIVEGGQRLSAVSFQADCVINFVVHRCLILFRPQTDRQSGWDLLLVLHVFSHTGHMALERKL